MSDWKKAAELDSETGELVYLELPKDGDLCLVWNKKDGSLTGPTFWSELSRAWTDNLGPNGSRVAGAINPPDADEYWSLVVLPTPEEEEPEPKGGVKKKAPASAPVQQPRKEPEPSPNLDLSPREPKTKTKKDWE